MKKIKITAEIEVEIGETEEDYCSEEDLLDNLRQSLEEYIEWQENRYTCKFKILRIIKENVEDIRQKEKINLRIFGNNSEASREPTEIVNKDLGLYKEICKCPFCNNQLIIFKSVMKIGKIEW
jgi:hypothetical protein